MISWLVRSVGRLWSLNGGQGILRKTAGYRESGKKKSPTPPPHIVNQNAWNHLHAQIMSQLMERFFVFCRIHSGDIQEFPPNSGQILNTFKPEQLPPRSTLLHGHNKLSLLVGQLAQ